MVKWEPLHCSADNIHNVVNCFAEIFFYLEVHGDWQGRERPVYLSRQREEPNIPRSFQRIK